MPVVRKQEGNWVHWWREHALVIMLDTVTEASSGTTLELWVSWWFNSKAIFFKRLIINQIKTPRGLIRCPRLVPLPPPPARTQKWGPD